VAQAVRDGVPPEELHQHSGSFVVNLITGPAGTVSADVDGLFEIGGGGTGFMLIKRGVFEALGADVRGFVYEQTVIKSSTRQPLTRNRQDDVGGLPLLPAGA